MYRLYYAPGAASLAAHWMLIELGVPHELRRLDLVAGARGRHVHIYTWLCSPTG